MAIVVGCGSQPQCNKCTFSSAIFCFEKEGIMFLQNVGSCVPSDVGLMFRTSVLMYTVARISHRRCEKDALNAYSVLLLCSFRGFRMKRVLVQYNKNKRKL